MGGCFIEIGRSILDGKWGFLVFKGFVLLGLECFLRLLASSGSSHFALERGWLLHWLDLFGF